jgi:MFS transporter, DHA1 family, tetracycline resistance protein
MDGTGYGRRLMQTQSPGKHALVFIFVTVLIDVIGIGIVIPVSPKLIAQLAHVDLSQAARYGGWLMFVYAGMQFIFAPVIGNLSDRYGRRPLLILSLLMLGIDYLIAGLAPTLFWLFLARFFSGIAGASFSTASAYIADVSPPEKRAGSFGLIGAAFGVGFMIGPALGGILGDISVRLPFFVSAGLALANAAYGFLVLKESLPPDKRRTFEWKRANPLGALAALKRFPGMLGLCGVLVLMRFAHDSGPSVWTYFTMLRFDWTMKEVGLSLMASGAITALAYAGLTRTLIPRLGEVRSAYVGLTAGALAYAGFAIATKGWMMYAWMSAFLLTALVMPSLNAMMSKLVSPREQGELQGALASLGSLSSVAAPPFMTNVFAYFTGPKAPVYFPGAAFTAASLCLIAAALMLRIAGARPGKLNTAGSAFVSEPNSGSS